MTELVPGYGHLWSITDRFGTFEHAQHAEPRRDHGYCTDDVARVLVVATRDPRPSAISRQLARGALRFVADAQDVTGASRNRRSADGRWHGHHTVQDCWGRTLWAFGTASAVDGWMGQAALAGFERGAQQRSPWPRAMAFAALGAAKVVTVDPWNRPAIELLQDAADLLGSPGTAQGWTWPEPRLTYANAVLPEAMVAAGSALARPALCADGLALLDWLLRRETHDGHLSVTPAAGAGPDDPVRGFDQQPIELAAMADACARAFEVDGSPRWLEGVRMSAAWFAGANDRGTRMWDETSGGAYDGLMVGGVNLNQGAESTLALLATFQQAARIAAVVG
jgi:hypothetical protein